MRYFFDILEPSGETRDSDGMRLGTPEEMRRQARRILARIAADEPYADDVIALSLRVRDEEDREVYNLCLSIKGRRRYH